MPPGRAKKSFKLSPLEQKLVVYFKAMLSYASIKKEVIRSLELSLLEGCVHAQAYFILFFLTVDFYCHHIPALIFTLGQPLLFLS